jgi:hypothetical protein
MPDRSRPDDRPYPALARRRARRDPAPARRSMRSGRPSARRTRPRSNRVVKRAAGRARPRVKRSRRTGLTRVFCHEGYIDSIRPCRRLAACGLVGEPDVCRPEIVVRRATTENEPMRGDHAETSSCGGAGSGPPLTAVQVFWKRNKRPGAHFADGERRFQAIVSSCFARYVTSKRRLRGTINEGRERGP